MRALLLLLVLLPLTVARAQAPLDQTQPDPVARAYLDALTKWDPEAAARCLDPATEGRGLPRFLQRELRPEASFDQVLTEMLLLPLSKRVQYVPGEMVMDGDTARLTVVATVTVPQTLVLRKGAEGKWIVDLEASAMASTGLGASVMLEGLALSEQTECLSNLKQLALAVLMWAQDHDEVLPPAKDWGKELFPYLKNEEVFRCPAVPGLECGYAYNADIAGRKLAEIADPAATVLFYESTLGQLDAADRGESQPRPGRHNGGNARAYVDGHGKWLAENQ
jgi:hypothetical protein